MRHVVRIRVTEMKLDSPASCEKARRYARELLCDPKGTVAVVLGKACSRLAHFFRHKI